jgi:hypothetical protein
MHRIQKRSRRVDVFDHFTGNDDLGSIYIEIAHASDVRTVNG